MIKNIFVYALILFKYQGTLVREEKNYIAYYKGGLLHCETGPAVKVTKESEMPPRGITPVHDTCFGSHHFYYKPNRLRVFITNTIKPLDISISTWSKNEQWWLDGKQLTKEEFDVITERIQLEKVMTLEPVVKTKMKNKI
jgi:hypothetical protein